MYNDFRNSVNGISSYPMKPKMEYLQIFHFGTEAFYICLTAYVERFNKNCSSKKERTKLPLRFFTLQKIAKMTIISTKNDMIDTTIGITTFRFLLSQEPVEQVFGFWSKLH